MTSPLRFHDASKSIPPQKTDEAGPYVSATVVSPPPGGPRPPEACAIIRSNADCMLCYNS